MRQLMFCWTYAIPVFSLLSHSPFPWHISAMGYDLTMGWFSCLELWEISGILVSVWDLQILPEPFLDRHWFMPQYLLTKVSHLTWTAASIISYLSLYDSLIFLLGVEFLPGRNFLCHQPRLPIMPSPMPTTEFGVISIITAPTRRKRHSLLRSANSQRTRIIHC